MQINLRKANAIQAEIKKAISAVKLETTVSVSEFTADVEAVLSKGELDFIQGINKKEALTKALFQIRAAVGRANVEAGISDVLAQAQQLDDIIGIKSAVTGLQERKEVSEINARIVKIKNSTGTDRASVLYGDRYNVVETGVLKNDRIDQTKAEVKMLKRDRQELNDKLLSLNVNTTIQLADPTIITLQAEGII
jgi:hypothetical protein